MALWLSSSALRVEGSYLLDLTCTRPTIKICSMRIMLEKNVGNTPEIWGRGWYGSIPGPSSNGCFETLIYLHGDTIANWVLGLWLQKTPTASISYIEVIFVVFRVEVLFNVGLAYFFSLVVQVKSLFMIYAFQAGLSVVKIWSAWPTDRSCRRELGPRMVWTI